MVARHILEQAPQFQWDPDSYPCKSTNCRPTAIAMIAGFYRDAHFGPQYVRNLMTGSNTCGGTTSSQGVAGLKALGVDADRGWLSPQAVKNKVIAGIPVNISVEYGLIPNIAMYQTDYNFNGFHAVVACKVVSQADHTGKVVPGILVRDPDHGSPARPERPTATFWPDWVWIPAFVSQSSTNATGLAVFPKAAKVLGPLLPYSAVEFVKTVQTTADDGLNVRVQPSTSATSVKKYPDNTKVLVSILTKVGGKYTYAGAVRSDWYGVRQSDATYLWIAAAYCKVL